MSFRIHSLYSANPNLVNVLIVCVVSACREAFNAFDTNKSGEIDAWELRDILTGLGRYP